MNNVRFKKNDAGFYDVRRMPEVVRLLEVAAQSVADKANDMAGTDEYRIGSQQGRKAPQGRWRTSVVTAGNHAKRDNAKHDTLLKALESVRT